jgi:hypothetical protein
MDSKAALRENGTEIVRLFARFGLGVLRSLSVVEQGCSRFQRAGFSARAGRGCDEDAIELARSE